MPPNPIFQLPYLSHPRVHPAIGEKSRTKQSFQAECNINNIMRKHEKTGLLDHVAAHVGGYGDFITSDDYHSAQNRILEAQASFNSLPANLRADFNNSPAEFLSFAQDPANFDEMVSLGLAEALPITAADQAAAEAALAASGGPTIDPAPDPVVSEPPAS